MLSCLSLAGHCYYDEYLVSDVKVLKVFSGVLHGYSLTRSGELFPGLTAVTNVGLGRVN